MSWMWGCCDKAVNLTGPFCPFPNSFQISWSLFREIIFSPSISAPAANRFESPWVVCPCCSTRRNESKLTSASIADSGMSIGGTVSLGAATTAVCSACGPVSEGAVPLWAMLKPDSIIPASLTGASEAIVTSERWVLTENSSPVSYISCSILSNDTVSKH